MKGGHNLAYQFTLRTTVVSEPGVSSRVGDYLKRLGVNSTLVVTDRVIREAGLIEGILDSLKNNDVPYVVFDDVKPNPKDTEVKTVTDYAREHKVNGLLAVGGGSAMDLAKGVGILLSHGGDIRDWEGDFTLERDIVPLICIPTTVGTGSEVTWISVITDTSRSFKMGIVDPKLAPRMALLDSEMIKSLPPSVAASTGLDALTHAIEAYTSRLASPLTDAFALQAMEMIRDNLETVVSDPKNEAAAEKMLTASMMAGIAFNNADVGSVHCLSEAIGAFYDLPHGVLNGIFLPYVYKRNMSADPVRHAKIATLLGADEQLSPDEAAQEGWNILMGLRKRLNLPTFNSLDKVSPQDFQQLAKVAKETPMDKSNIRELSEKDYLDIMLEAFAEA